VANRKRCAAAQEWHRNEAGTLASATASSGGSGERTDKAAASNTNRGIVQRMDKLVKDRPDLTEKVVAGEVKSTEAMRRVRKD